MKTWIIIVGLVFGTTAFAQYEPSKEYKNSFKFIPTKLHRHTVGIGYQRELRPDVSFVALSELIYFEKYVNYQKGYQQRFAIKKHIFMANSVPGFSAKIFIMPYVEFGMFDFQDQRSVYCENNYGYYSEKMVRFLDRRNFTEYGGGLLLGLELVSFYNFSVEMYLGGGVKYNTFQEPDYPCQWDPYEESLDGEDYRRKWEIKGIVPVGNIEFGYKF